jgi:hypothetical protein
VTAFLVNHGSWPQAFGYRFDTPGRSVVISGDCAPSDSVIKNCNGSRSGYRSRRRPVNRGPARFRWRRKCSRQWACAPSRRW